MKNSHGYGKDSFSEALYFAQAMGLKGVKKEEGPSGNPALMFAEAMGLHVPAIRQSRGRKAAGMPVMKPELSFSLT